jgi:hypothetical protein
MRLVMPTETPEPTAALADARRALRCLYVQVPEEVARDVGTKVEAAFAALATAADRAAQAERLKIAREAARLSKRDDMSDEQALEALLGVYNDCLSFQTDCAGCAAATSRDYDVQCRIDEAADRARQDKLDTIETMLTNALDALGMVQNYVNAALGEIAKYPAAESRDAD